MNPFEMVVIIVIVAVGAGIAKHYINAQSELTKRETAEDRERSDDRLQNIEKRLQILERIVTSDGYDLKQQFKNLDENNS